MIPGLLVHGMQAGWREAELCDWARQSHSCAANLLDFSNLAEVQLDTLIRTELTGLQTQV